MVNEIPTLLANHPAGEGDLWYIDPSFAGITIPSRIRKIYKEIVGENVDMTVMCLMSLLNCVDIQQYKSVFDSRELFDNISDVSIYDLYKNTSSTDYISTILSIKNIEILFSGDDYLKNLSEIYKSSNESVVRVCAIILALAYNLRTEFIREGGR